MYIYIYIYIYIHMFGKLARFVPPDTPNLPTNSIPTKIA